MVLELNIYLYPQNNTIVKTKILMDDCCGIVGHNK